MKDINRIKKMIRVVVYAIGFGLIIGGGIGIAYLNKIDKEYISTIVGYVAFGQREFHESRKAGFE